MFRKSSKTAQLKIFTSPKSLFSGKSLSLYEDGAAWNNQFRQQVTMRVDENIFRPLYCDDNGTPNFPIRILISMMVLKEAEGLSDQKLLDQLLKIDGNKVVYTYSSEEVKTRLQELGKLIYSILPLFSSSSSTHYTTLQRVFDEQFKVFQIYIPRTKK